MEKPKTLEFFYAAKKNKDGLNTRCKICVNNYQKSSPAKKAWMVKNKEKLLEINREFHKNNPNKGAEYAKAWRSRNHEKSKAISKEYHSKHRHTPEYKSAVEKYLTENADKLYGKRVVYRFARKESIKQYNKEYYEKNKADAFARVVKRNAFKLKRTPKYLTEDDDFLFSEIYQLSMLRTKATGIKWEVDHILPLLGKTVSGLHVPSNLRVIPKVVNSKKSNKFRPGDFTITASFFG